MYLGTTTSFKILIQLIIHNDLATSLDPLSHVSVTQAINNLEIKIKGKVFPLHATETLVGRGY
jgi:hypothetical protein